MLVNIVLVTKGFDANWVSGRARSSHGSVGIRGAVGALKLRGPSWSGSGSYSLGGERVYDPSASLRAGSGPAHGSADSRQRYCANLGHRQDDETGTYTGGSPDGDGLVYMRARYYEPTTGRFVSEDPGRQGTNYFVYCGSDPVNCVDGNGKSWDIISGILNTLMPLLQQFGLRGLLGVAKEVGARAAGALFESIGVALMGVSLDLDMCATRLAASSEHWMAKLAGFVVGRVSAWAMGLGMNLRYLGALMSTFGDDLDEIEFMDIRQIGSDDLPPPSLN